MCVAGVVLLLLLPQFPEAWVIEDDQQQPGQLQQAEDLAGVLAPEGNFNHTTWVSITWECSTSPSRQQLASFPLCKTFPHDSKATARQQGAALVTLGCIVSL